MYRLERSAVNNYRYSPDTLENDPNSAGLGLGRSGRDRLLCHSIPDRDVFYETYLSKAQSKNYKH